MTFSILKNSSAPQLCITLDGIFESEFVAELLTSKNLSELAILTLYLMYEKKTGQDSFWAPYIQVREEIRSAYFQGVLSPPCPSPDGDYAPHLPHLHRPWTDRGEGECKPWRALCYGTMLSWPICSRVSGLRGAITKSIISFLSLYQAIVFLTARFYLDFIYPTGCYAAGSPLLAVVQQRLSGIREEYEELDKVWLTQDFSSAPPSCRDAFSPAHTAPSYPFRCGSWPPAFSRGTRLICPRRPSRSRDSGRRLQLYRHPLFTSRYET